MWLGGNFGSHVVMLIGVVCRWSRFPRSACRGSVVSLSVCSFFLFHSFFTCVPGSCPCLPRHSHTLAAYLLHNYYEILHFFIYYTLYGCLYYVAWFLFSFVTLGFTKTIYMLWLIRGIMTTFDTGRLGQWVFLWRHHLDNGCVLGWWVDLAIPVVEMS